MSGRLTWIVVSRQTEQVLRYDMSQDNASWLASKLRGAGIPCDAISKFEYSERQDRPRNPSLKLQHDVFKPFDSWRER